MRKNGLESIFRERFNKHQEDIDAEDMITRMQLGQPKKNKRRFIFWLFGFSILMMVTVGIIQYSNDDNLQIVFNDSPIKHDSKVQSETVSKNEKTQQLSNHDIKSNQDSRALTTPNHKKSIDQQNSTLTKNNANPINQLSVMKSEINLIDNSELSHNQRKLKSKIVSKETSKDKSNKSIHSISQSNKTTFHRELLLQMPILSTLNGVLFENTAQLIAIKSTLSEHPNLISPTPNIKKSIFLEPYTTISFIDRSLKTNLDNYNQHVELRNQSEMPLEAIQLGLSVTKTFGKTLYVAAGLEYTQINEKANLQYESDTILIDDDFPILLQINSNGDSTTTYGTSNLNSIVNHTLTEYNHHRIYALPIRLGLQGKSKKILWFADAGLSLNLYGGFYGKMYDLENNIVAKPQYLKSKIGFDYRANLGFGFTLSNKIDLLLSGKFQHNFISISDTQYISQSYKLNGLKLSLRYHLEN